MEFNSGIGATIQEGGEMTKQEEIREMVKDYLVGSIHGATVSYGDLNGYDQSTVDFHTEELLGELSKQGVVIKVDSDLLDAILKLCVVNLEEGRGYPDCMAGYVAVEPLIKGGNPIGFVNEH